MSHPFEDEELNRALRSFLEDDSISYQPYEEDERPGPPRIQQRHLIDYIYRKSQQLESELQGSTDKEQIREELARVLKLSYAVIQQGPDHPQSVTRTEIRNILDMLGEAGDFQVQLEGAEGIEEDDLLEFYQELEQLESDLSPVEKAQIMSEAFILLSKNLLDDDFARICIAFALTPIYFHIRAYNPTFEEMMNIVTYWILALTIMSGLFEPPEID
ncbi:hypothetical protein G3I44_14335 [Halogeometricum borinquense]|uniref:Uncharacterized protein n=1 Tax=Halogeometricum borinquense TaxID=60847 RepID=A0A6C0UIH2_9EURY|nr:hypothetical protein [Halogeometricum borinquense]QIB75364.1 hypothetical protein G3I44_14335 [Halogeometricum borinquense]